MQEVTRRCGGKAAALVYEELRKLAAQRLTQEKPGQTSQATALVHEAYLRLVDVDVVWALLRRKIRVKGPLKLLVAFGSAFRSN